MPTLIVVDQVADWPFDIPGAEVIDARTYLTADRYAELRGARVFNLCRSYRYQSAGYYVTLLATARGHKPLPSVTAIQDMKSQTVVRFVSEDLEELIQRELAPIQSTRFTLSVYFGRNLAKRYDRLSMHLFNLFHAPLLRAQFSRNGKWHLRSISPVPLGEIPDKHLPFVTRVASEYFAGRRPTIRKRAPAKYDLAILVNEQEELAPSNAGAIARFVRAAESLGLETELIGRDDYARLAEFDALFIRETTRVNHYTYRFARRASIEKLVVIDDPESIVRCSNKVYLAELLGRHKVPMPRSLVVHRDNLEEIGAELGFPCVLKQPDSSFSQGVVKVETPGELEGQAAPLLQASDLVVAQEFLPTTFDWRIGVFNRKPIFACRYHMVPNHWQIRARDGAGRHRYGRAETIPVELAPRRVVQVACRAANLIGDGLYGVDVKEIGRQPYVVEVNDNPNVDAGVEDRVLKQELYERIMNVFLERIEARKAGREAA